MTASEMTGSGLKHLALCTVLVAIAVVSGTSVAARTEAVQHEVRAVNGVFTDLDSAFGPIEQGSLTLVPSSPEHRLTVHRNQLAVKPTDAPGVVDLSFAADLEGDGLLQVEILGAGPATRLADRVVAPRQWVSAEARVELRRLPSGYRLTIIKPLSPKVQIRIDSQLAGKLVRSCRVFSLLPFLGTINCDAVGESLAVVNVPMPEPGEVYLLDDQYLDDQDRAFLDRFAEID